MACTPRFRWLILALLTACGGRTPLDLEVDAEVVERPIPGEEICSGLDEDLDGIVDEGFRDDAGRYMHPDHCGGCGMPCAPTRAREVAAECMVIDETAVCAATECAAGFAPSATGRCVAVFDRLCLPCLEDADCGEVEGQRCTDVGGEMRCVAPCGPGGPGCPAGYSCRAEGFCAPLGRSCACEPGDMFDLACALLDPEGNRCPGAATCNDGLLSECVAPMEVCDEADNDCDGVIDEGYRDRRGAYILDPQHCGECGIDCTDEVLPDGDLTCGGDPFAPSCVLLCPDAADGIMPGDRIDADRDIATGCECTVGSLDDQPGPLRAEGEDLDVNCDGADGIVLESFYVAPDGNDDGPGSPTRPLRTIQVALERAAESLGSEEPRPHVFIASGDYTEVLELPDGVLVHGGYRRDFLALDPDGFRVEVRAPTDATSPGGAALVVDGAGRRPTRVEWLTLRGRDALTPSTAAFGAALLNPGRQLTLADATIIAGVPGSGMNGTSGSAGGESTTAAEAGDPPRGAIENAMHVCQSGPPNTVAGGDGGVNSCAGSNVSGGNGGSPGCPVFAMFQPSGRSGQGAGAGSGGTGGQDSQGPISGPGCPGRPLCCGLADFTVPTDFRGPQSGTAGRDGRPGAPGGSCDDALGTFMGPLWVPADASMGTGGSAGSGGGGGGGGGGAVMDWNDGLCEFVDGIGGGGGGGGAGGCGGDPGTPGTSGGPSVAVLVRFTGAMEMPTLSGLALRPSDGGRGGDGGAGGDGGRGGTGGLGGELPREDRSTPTLSGPFPGGRGGLGGSGGSGGGAGAGCGGGSIGIWVTGGRPDVAAWEADNTFMLGAGGLPGQGGGGDAPAAPGAEGGAVDVVVR
ncbi:MAG: hypothetical protein JJ863_01290 [Deltaproteobacteria bacterium]|nr:hypothetical protein [Deltaproteobacteria bacterium]